MSQENSIIEELNHEDTSFEEASDTQMLQNSAEKQPDIKEMTAEEFIDMKTKILPYHERYYLKYREGKRRRPDCQHDRQGFQRTV
jgi:hypothetical protein